MVPHPEPTGSSDTERERQSISLKTGAFRVFYMGFRSEQQSCSTYSTHFWEKKTKAPDLRRRPRPHQWAPVSSDPRQKARKQDGGPTSSPVSVSSSIMKVSASPETSQTLHKSGWIRGYTSRPGNIMRGREMRKSVDMPKNKDNRLTASRIVWAQKQQDPTTGCLSDRHPKNLQNLWEDKVG